VEQTYHILTGEERDEISPSSDHRGLLRSRYLEALLCQDRGDEGRAKDEIFQNRSPFSDPRLVVSSSGSAGAQSASVASQASARANVNGISIMYLDQGQGTAVVFVHGAFFDHRAWEGQREAIVQRYRFIAVTQRYFGTSPWTDNGEKFSVVTHVDDLAAFIRGINVGPAHVVGWSYSGPIALALALQYPQLVKSLFVWEPALPTVVADPEDAKVMARTAGRAPVPQSRRPRPVTMSGRSGSALTV